MARGRKSHADSPKRWDLTLPSSVAEAVEDQLRDPLTGRVIYGARNKLLTKLLREWLRDRQQYVDLPDVDLDTLNQEIIVP